jgi:TolB protein
MSQGDLDTFAVLPNGRIMSINGLNARPVVSLDSMDAAYPAWSRDGKWIVFRSTRSGEAAIWVRKADGTGLRRLTSMDRGEDSPSFTSDGRVVFDDIYGYLRIVNFDGYGTKYLFADTSFVDNAPAVSPDGTKVVFVRQVMTSANIVLPRTFVANLDGTQALQLSNFATGADWTPAWSPDGSRVVFSHDANSVFELWLVNVDGTDLHQLPHTAGSSFRPAW